MKNMMLAAAVAMGMQIGFSAEENVARSVVMFGGKLLAKGGDAPIAKAFAEEHAKAKGPVDVFVVPATNDARYAEAIAAVRARTNDLAAVILLADPSAGVLRNGDAPLAALRGLAQAIYGEKDGRDKVKQLPFVQGLLNDSGADPYAMAQSERVSSRKNWAFAVELGDLGPAEAFDAARMQEAARRLVRVLVNQPLFFWSLRRKTAPVVDTVRRSDGGLVVTFDEASARGKPLVQKRPLTGLFEVSGVSGAWHPAEAALEGKSVRVTCAKVSAPFRVRYCWGAKIVGSALFSAEDIPVAPFETMVNDWKDEVDAEVRHVIRPGGVAQPDFWNVNARWFMYAPSFAFTNFANAAKYVFTVTPKGKEPLVFEADSAIAPLSPVWNRVPVGFATVRCVAVDGDGRELGVAGERPFARAAAFDGHYPPRQLGYASAAALCFDYILSWPSMRHLVETGRPDPKYPLNCYPSKMHGAIASSFAAYAKGAKGVSRAAATKLAKAAADYLISIMQPADAPLAGFPPTYAGGLTEAASASQGQHMLIYPAEAGLGLVRTYELTKEAKYLGAAKRIAETFLRIQGEDGTWYLKLYEKDGRPVAPNRLMPLQVIDFLSCLYADTGDARYRDAADRAFTFIEAGPVKTWNWEGQFEDVTPTKPYENLTKHDACSAAIYLCRRYPKDKARIALARELLRFSEDQFVVWRKTYSPTWTKMDWWFNPDAQVIHPHVCEQYHCYAAIDASAAKLIRTYLALYDVEKNPLDLAKARALGDSVTRIQNDDGRIRTFWHNWQDDNVGSDWVNCMVSAAEALDLLAKYE